MRANCAELTAHPKNVGTGCICTLSSSDCKSDSGKSIAFAYVDSFSTAAGTLSTGYHVS